MKPLTITIIAVLLLGVGGIVGYFTNAKPDLTAPLAASEAHAAALAKQVSALGENETRLKGEVAMLQSKLSAATADAAALKTAAAKTPARGAMTTPAPRDTGAKPFDALSKMMKNPAMREMAKQQQIAMQDMQYGDLYPMFHFTDEEKAHFKQLLSDRTSLAADMGFRLMDSTLTPEARKAILDESNQQKELNNQSIRDFLNSDDDYNTFKHYEDTKGERMMLAMSKGAFAAAPLSPDQETQLVDTMHTVATRPGNVPNLNQPQNFDPTKFTQADIDQQLQMMDRNAQAVRDAAGQFLSPQQIEALKQAQASIRAMTSTSFNMMKSMGGGAK